MTKVFIYPNYFFYSDNIGYILSKNDIISIIILSSFLLILLIIIFSSIGGDKR